MPWVKLKAAADLPPVACHSSVAAVDRRRQVVAVRFWFRGPSASASGLEQAMRSARENSEAARLWYPVRSASALGQE